MDGKRFTPILERDTYRTIHAYKMNEGRNEACDIIFKAS
jgi:hypothetical protein